MGITVEQATESGPQDIDAGGVLAEFQTAIADDGRSLNQIAIEVGIGYSTLAAWRNGKYAGDNDKVAQAVRAWLTRRVAQARTTTVMPTDPGFVLTKTASQIFDVLEFTQTAVRMAVVVGAAGVGKTTALRAYQKRYPTSVWVATMQPCHKLPRALLEELSFTLRQPRDHRSADISRAIQGRLEGTRGLMIIDEAQHLDAEALDQVRSLYDATGIGFVLAGNPELMTKLGAIKRSPNMAQIFSRIGLRYSRSRPLQADVTALLDGWGVKGEVERTELLGIAMKPGGVRVMTNVIGQAFVQAYGEGAEGLKLAHIQRAYEQLGGAA